MEGHLLFELSALCFHKIVLIKKPRTSKSCLWFPIWQLLSVRVLRLMVSKCFWWRAIYCGYDHFIITQIHVPSQKLFFSFLPSFLWKGNCIYNHCLLRAFLMCPWGQISQNMETQVFPFYLCFSGIGPFLSTH